MKKHYKLEAFLGTTPARDADITFWLDGLAKSFQGFNLTSGLGYWLGKKEHSIAIAVIVPESALIESLEMLKAQVAEYCGMLREDCVLVTVSEVKIAVLVGVHGEI